MNTMHPSLLLWLVVILVAYPCPSVAQVQQWNSAKSVAGDLLLNAVGGEKQTRTAGRHSKSSSRSKSSKGSKSRTKGSQSSSGTKSTKSDKSSSRSSDESSSDSDSSSKSDKSSSSKSEDKSSSTKSEDKSSSSKSEDKSSSSKSEDKSSSTNSEDRSSSTKSDKDSSQSTRDKESSSTSSTDRTESSSSSQSSRDPSKTSDSTDSKSKKEEEKPQRDSEDVSPDSEDVIKDSEDDITKDSEEDVSKPVSPPSREPTMPTTADSETEDSTSVEPSRTPTVSSDDEKDNVFNPPTREVTPEPTYAPTATPPCELNRLGAYGTISADRREFEFFYQVETTSDVDQDIFTNEILPVLEKEIGTRIVASIFDECRVERRRLQEGPDTCEARGFSRLPLDRALAGVPCMSQSRIDNSNTCYAVDGGVRMYFDGECSNATDEAMSVIKEVVNAGDYDRLDTRIVNVIYLDISDIDFDAEITTTKSSGGSETKVPGYAIILLTVFSLGLVVSLLLFLGRRKTNDKGFDTVPDDEGEGDF